MDRLELLETIGEWEKELKEKKRNTLKAHMMSFYIDNLGSKNKEAKEALSNISDGLKKNHMYLSLEVQALDECIKELKRQLKEKDEKIEQMESEE